MSGFPYSLPFSLGDKHERREIRDAVVAALTGKTVAESRIYKSRRAPIPTAKLPALCVYTDSETVDPATVSTAPRELKRILTLVVEGWISADGANADQLDDLFDALALEIETAIDLDDSLGGTVFWCAPAATEFGVTVEGSRPMGCVHIEFTAVYHSELRTGTQDDERDNLDAIDVKTRGADWDPDPAHVPPTEDLVTGIHE